MRPITTTANSACTWNRQVQIGKTFDKSYVVHGKISPTASRQEIGQRNRPRLARQFWAAEMATILGGYVYVAIILDVFAF